MLTCSAEKPPQGTQRMKTTIIIPTYNEVENLPLISEAIFALNIPDLSMMVVDDNSPDGTGRMADELTRRYPGKFSVIHRPGKMGFASAYLQGFKALFEQGVEAIMQMDADFSHPVERVPAMLEALPGVDYVIGSRYVNGGSLDDNWPFWRKALSGFGNQYARTILGLNIRDVTAGFELWSTRTLQRMPLERITSSGYIYQVELKYVATLLGFKCREIPIHFADRRWGQSKMSLRIQLEAAVKTWSFFYRYKDLRGDTLTRQ